MSQGFTRQQSMAIKGIAIIMMMIHHCFLDESRYAGFHVDFSPFSVLFFYTDFAVF